MTTRGSAAIRYQLSTVNYPLTNVNEAETRAEHIDPALAAAGWGVVDGSRIRREYPITLGRIEGHGRRGKALKADYVLEYRNTKLATVEAKAWDQALTEGVGQAKDYATKLAIRHTYATNGQGIYGIDMQTGHEAEVPRYPSPDDLLIEGDLVVGERFVESDFNKKIEIKEREAHRVKIFMDQIDQREKTLVFCANQDHALMVRDLINQMKTSTNPDYCVRVTANDGERGEQHLKEFQDNEKTIPTILTTSQKLSTGVDARNVRNIVLLRPINSMIEFKQIIGRGTRLYDGKDYFTIYDFVKAYHHFSDPEWDGEPLDPEACPSCGQRPCGCERPDPEPCPDCGKRPCECPKEPCEVCGKLKCVCEKKKRAKVKLADGKARNIQHMMMTSFWHPDGTPMSSQQFMEMLFVKLPEFFHDETELRTIWSAPDTRAKLLEALAAEGFGHDQLAEMQRIIDADKSDLFDVLAHVAYALPPVTREVRAANARVHIDSEFNAKQRAFLAFVLAHYVSEGVEELDQRKLTPLLRLKYHDSLSDALADLGKPEEIGRVFAGFQKYLYQGGA